MSLIVFFISLFFNSSLLFANSSYKGSSFNEIQSVLYNQKIITLNEKVITELDSYKGGMPVYRPFVDSTILRDANRTLTEEFDYYERLEKRIHGNGICFLGTWSIYSHDKFYTGYFKKNQKALFVGRVSVTTDNTNTGQKRTFGFAGKIFPTLNPNEIVKTGNFFSVDFLLGSKIRTFTETALSNQPEIISNLVETDWKFVAKALDLGKIFSKANKEPSFRPVSNIAKLGLSENDRFNSPNVIVLKTIKDFNFSVENGMDFREELNLNNYPRGLRILISAGETKEKVTPIGEINLQRSIVSYGCDRQLHFAHPKVTP